MDDPVWPTDPIIITRRIPSQNRSQYRHWSIYAQERDAWFVLLRQQFAPRTPIITPVTLRIESFRNRLVDFANLVGGAKMIPDCLIRLGWLKDDSPQWFHADYRQYQVPRHEERTVITYLGESLPAN